MEGVRERAGPEHGRADGVDLRAASQPFVVSGYPAMWWSNVVGLVWTTPVGTNIPQNGNGAYLNITMTNRGRGRTN